jgi:hypothetical protein
VRAPYYHMEVPPRIHSVRDAVFSSSPKTSRCMRRVPFLFPCGLLTLKGNFSDTPAELRALNVEDSPGLLIEASVGSWRFLNYLWSQSQFCQHQSRSLNTTALKLCICLGLGKAFLISPVLNNFALDQEIRIFPGTPNPSRWGF